MNQELFDWLLLLVRWLHITVAVTWIGTSIFFMWLDRSFEPNPASKRPGHIGELWMVHGGGFYHVEKLLMGPTKVPDKLHWFKWESYWTWLSGMMLVFLHYYTGEGTMLLDSMVSDISFKAAIGLSLFSVFGSWIFYDFLWERKLTREIPILGHFITWTWVAGMSWLLCRYLSGRAAYIHMGAMLGTWMTANVFMRIIPRQIKMVEASSRGEAVNQDWAKNAKHRSTHNTYLTLPVIFIMISNHFPQTYGHDLNWLILLVITLAGAAIREYFVVRISQPKRSMISAVIGIALIAGVIVFSQEKGTEVQPNSVESNAATVKNSTHDEPIEEQSSSPSIEETKVAPSITKTLKGVVTFSGQVPAGKKLNLPAACAKLHAGTPTSDEVLVKNGKLQNVLVRIIAGHEAHPASPVPTNEVILDQKGCVYSPRVVGARVGQKVTFLNSDNLFHNVRSVTNLNQRFNVAMPHKDQRETKIFQKPELFVQTKCSVHPWMTAYVAVMEHPYFSVTNQQGEFEIKNVPKGKYTLEAWHEIFGTQKIEINIIEEGQPEVIKFNFKQE